MPLDPSIPLKAQAPAQPNPFATFGDAAKAANVMTQLQANRLALQGRNALLGAYDGVGTDSATGLPDYKQVVNNLLATPGGGLVVGTVAQQAQEAAKRAFDLNSAAVKQQQQRMGALGNFLAPLQAKGANVTAGDVYGAIATAGAAGLPISDLVTAIAPTMPHIDPRNPNDPGYGARLQSWVMGVVGSSRSSELQNQMFTPRPTATDLGDIKVFPDMNPITNPEGGSTTLYNGLPPSEQNAPRPGPLDAQNRPTVISGAQAAARNGNAGLVRRPFGAASPSSTSLLPQGYTGRTQAPGAPPGGGAAAPPGTAPAGAPLTPATAPPMPVGLPPGQAAAAEAAGSRAGEAVNTMYTQAGSANGRIYQLQQALAGLQNAGTTGPGTETMNRVVSFLNSSPAGLLTQYLPGFDPSKVASYDEANKYLTQYASNLAGAQGSDQKLATALSGNASVHISNLAARDVVKATIGMERMGQAQAQAFAATGLSADQFSRWQATTWAPNSDPRAYVMDQMTPDQRAKVLGSLSTTPDASGTSARSRFLDQVWHAAENGLIDPAVLRAGQGAPAAAPAASAPAPSSTTPPAVNLGLDADPAGIPRAVAR